MFPQYWLYIFLHNRILLATWWQVIWPKSGVFSQSLSLCCWSDCLYFEQYHAVRITKFFYVLKISRVRISPSRVILFAVLLWIFYANYEKNDLPISSNDLQWCFLRWNWIYRSDREAFLSFFVFPHREQGTHFLYCPFALAALSHTWLFAASKSFCDFISRNCTFSPC